MTDYEKVKQLLIELRIPFDIYEDYFEVTADGGNLIDIDFYSREEGHLFKRFTTYQTNYDIQNNIENFLRLFKNIPDDLAEYREDVQQLFQQLQKDFKEDSKFKEDFEKTMNYLSKYLELVYSKQSIEKHPELLTYDTKRPDYPCDDFIKSSINF